MSEKEGISYEVEKRDVPIIDGINQLKKDVESTTNFRNSLCEKLGISVNMSKNNSTQNFLLGVINGLMEFPIIVELYVKNSGFRDAFWIELKNLSISDFSQAIGNISEGLLTGDAYKKGNSTVKSLLLLTGIGGILRQFGVVVMTKGSNIILTKIGVSATAVGIHSTGYALGERGKNVAYSKTGYTAK